MGLWIGPEAWRHSSSASHQPPPGSYVPAGQPLFPSRAEASKPDRLVVGVLAGTVLFYVLGKALGLGRR